MAVRTFLHVVLPFPRKAVWNILSQTDWMNRSLGLRPVTYEFTPLQQGGARVIAQTQWSGLRLRWEELPFEWMEEEFYSVQRVFEKGPFSVIKLRFGFAAPTLESTAITITNEIHPRNLAGHAVAHLIFKWKLQNDLQKLLRHLSDHLEGQKVEPLPNLPKTAVRDGPLALGLAELRKYSVAPGLVERLNLFLRQANDLDLAHIRPLAIARRWGEDPWQVLGLFLYGTRAGLLNFSWEILCPNCRTAPRTGVASLGDLKKAVHCDACQISFDGEFDRSVELKFSVHPAIKSTSRETFCLAGPGTKPHIVFQRLIPPGGRESFPPRPVPFPCRIRSPQVASKFDLGPLGLARERRLITCHPGGFEEERSGTDDDQTLDLEIFNPNPFPIQVIGERSDWPEDVLTAARVTNWQEFRDLFAAEVISPTEQITVGSQVILFTDLRGSTAMYTDIGDSPAYALVRRHFEILIEVIREHHGTLIKTIGDAVMAGFSRVEEALQAVEQMHRRLAADFAAKPGRTELRLKSSLHLGPCLAVNANDKLDFFGTTVNLAARLVECCRGGDLAITQTVYQRPETQVFLARLGTACEPSEVRLKGFTDPFQLWLISIL